MLQSVARMQTKKEGPNLLTIKLQKEGKKLNDKPIVAQGFRVHFRLQSCTMYYTILSQSRLALREFLRKFVTKRVPI